MACDEMQKKPNLPRNWLVNPLSDWDAMSSRWVCEWILQTVAKRLHGIAKSSHASRTGCQSFKHVILFCATKNIAKPSPSHRICRQPVANPSQTFASTSQGSFRDLHNATKLRPFRDLIAINKTDQNSHERCETLARMSHDCRETLARISRDCRETVARMTHDCRTVVRCSHECLMTVVRHWRECLTTVVRLSSIYLNICRDHKVQCDRKVKNSKKSRLYRRPLSPTSREVVGREVVSSQ